MQKPNFLIIKFRQILEVRQNLINLLNHFMATIHIFEVQFLLHFRKLEDRRSSSFINKFLNLSSRNSIKLFIFDALVDCEEILERNIRIADCIDHIFADIVNCCNNLFHLRLRFFEKGEERLLHGYAFGFYFVREGVFVHEFVDFVDFNNFLFVGMDVLGGETLAAAACV